MKTSFFAAILATVFVIALAGNKPEILSNRIPTDNTSPHNDVPTTPQSSDSLKQEGNMIWNYPFLFYPKPQIFLAQNNCWNTIAQRCN